MFEFPTPFIFGRECQNNEKERSTHSVDIFWSSFYIATYIGWINEIGVI
jgi:hypothetical protein